jgi:hypothetical protein
MTEEPGLFAEPEHSGAIRLPALTSGERRQSLVATRIANGEHPLGRPVLLHHSASRTILEAGHETTLPTCGDCKFRVLLKHNTRTYPKCWYPDLHRYPHPRDTGCESSDIRAWWPACREFERK